MCQLFIAAVEVNFNVKCNFKIAIHYLPIFRLIEANTSVLLRLKENEIAKMGVHTYTGT